MKDTLSKARALTLVLEVAAECIQEDGKYHTMQDLGDVVHVLDKPNERRACHLCEGTGEDMMGASDDEEYGTPRCGRCGGSGFVTAQSLFKFYCG
jgi:hypothetical protein